MIGVTLFGLVLTPVFYVVLRKLFPGKLHHAESEPAHTAERPRSSPLPAQTAH